jgi:hypothetical protein
VNLFPRKYTASLSGRYENKPKPTNKLGRRIQSKMFWQWCITLTFTGFVYFVHPPVFQMTRKCNWSAPRKCNWSLSFFRWGDQLLKLALSKGPNRVGVSLAPAEDGNRSNFRIVVISSYLKFQTMDKAQKSNEYMWAEFCMWWPAPCQGLFTLNVTIMARKVSSADRQFVPVFTTDRHRTWAFLDRLQSFFQTRDSWSLNNEPPAMKWPCRYRFTQCQ